MDTGTAASAGSGLDDADSAFFSRRGHRRCCCFPWPSSSPSSSSPHARRVDEQWWHGVGGAGAARRWWWRRGVDALMKVREWSELAAGPRWKTFIRRFRRGSPRHHGAAAAGGGGCGGKLNYDPLSYALNFDEGHHGGSSPEGGDYGGYRALRRAPRLRQGVHGSRRPRRPAAALPAHASDIRGRVARLTAGGGATVGSLSLMGRRRR